MSLVTFPRQILVDANGRPRVGAKASYYQAGTSTPIVTYTSGDYDVPNAHPVVSLPGGYFPEVHINPVVNTSYKVVYTDSADVELLSADNQSTTGVSGADIGSLIYIRTGAEISAGVTPTTYLYPTGDIRRYGARCDGATDDSSAINTALSVGGRICVPANLTTRATQLTMSVQRTTLIIEAGATLSQMSATNTLITVSAAYCTISGPGRLLSPASFDGTNSRRTYAVIWVTANDFHADGLTLENIPRSGIHFEDATLARITNCRLLGNFPYASYGGTNTGHCGIDYNPPAEASSDDEVGLVITGNIIERCVQGAFMGNFDSAALESGFTVVGNHFNQCWDHGVYTTIGEGVNVSSNTFLSCKIPVVVDGVAPVVTGNTLYSTETVQTNGNQVISIRNAQGAVIANNSLYGPGAAILCDTVAGTTIRDNVIKGNTIISTAAGQATSAIRLGLDATTCENNLIEGNVISGGNFGEFVGAIQLEMATGSTGQGNVVRGNTIKVTNACYNIQLSRQNNAVVEGNVVESNYSAPSAYTSTMIFLSNCTDCSVARNTLVWRTGGTNVTARGISIENTCTNTQVVNNWSRLTSGSLTGSSAIVDSGVTSFLWDNYPYMAGSATYDPGSLGDGAGVTTTVTCNGALVGDFVTVSFSVALADITMTAWVSASNTVSVRFQNESGGTVDLASGTLKVYAQRRQ